MLKEQYQGVPFYEMKHLYLQIGHGYADADNGMDAIGREISLYEELIS